MKTINPFLSIIAIALFVIASQSANAQKILFNSSNGKTIIDGKTVSYSCSIEELTSPEAANDLASKIKATKGVYSAVILNYVSGTANMVIKLFKMENGITLQKALIGAGIDVVYIDGIAVKSTEIVDFMKNKNKK